MRGSYLGNFDTLPGGRYHLGVHGDLSSRGKRGLGNMALGFWRSPYSCHLFCVPSSENVSRVRGDRASWPEGRTLYGKTTERDVANTLPSRRW